MNQLVEDIRCVNPVFWEIVQEVRMITARAAPPITEMIKYGGILFQFGQPFCGVFTYQHHVSLEFGNGHALDDPHGVLEGGGKYRRHIKLKSADDLIRKHVAGYIQQALALGMTE